MLKVDNLTVAYGGIQAVRGGEIITLIGANGAGKSTLLRAISGLQRPAGGEVFFDGRRITGLPAHELVARGLVLVPEGRRIFPNMTVRENLELGAYLRADRTAIARSIDQVYARFPRLAERRKQLAGTLSGGEQQMLAIARALMSAPKLLLLDEPSMGLSPILVREIFTMIRQINADGATILLVEQNAHMALGIAGRGYVLETGRIVLAGAATALEHDPQVRQAYLGGEVGLPNEPVDA